MTLFKRIMAWTLTLVMLVSAFPLQVLAQGPDDADAVVTAEDVNVQGTNSLGMLLSDAINEEEDNGDEEEYKSGYAVSDITVAGNTVVVTYASLEEANLVVGIYSEDGLRMLNSATARVSPDQTQAALTLEGEMPEYFLVNAYLLDIYDFSPLCPAFESPMYTQDMQELLAMSVEDAKEEYGEEQVYSLDGSEDTNFAVYSQNAIVIDEVEGVNTVASVDEENRIYSFSDADETLKGLQEDDVVIYVRDDGQLIIFKVGVLTVSEDTVTVTGAELELGEAFSVMKLENEGDEKELTVDETDIYEGLESLGLSEGSQTYGTRAARGIDTNVTYRKGFHYKLYEKDFKGEKNTANGKVRGTGSIDASFFLGIEVNLNLYLSWKRQYIHFKITPNVTLDVEFSGTVAFDAIKLGALGWIPVPGVYVDFTPTVTVSFTGEAKFSLSGRLAFGFTAEHKSGKKMTSQKIYEKPRIESSLEIQATLFFGFNLGPKISIVSEHVASASMTGQLGFRVTGKTGWTGTTALETQRHACDLCIQGDVKVVATLSATVSFLDSKKLTVTLDILKKEVKLFDFYYSFDTMSGDTGMLCPNLAYLVVVKVEDTDRKPIAGATVRTKKGTVLGKTNENGVLGKTYFTRGTHTLEATVNNQTVSTSLSVSRPCVHYITCDPSGGDNGGSGAGTTVQQRPTQEEVKLPAIIPDEITTEAVPPSDGSLYNGKFGDNILWSFFEDGTLEIMGKGAMKEVTHQNDIPWNSLGGRVQSVVIHEGVTSICYSAFVSFENLTQISFPSTLKKIGENAFSWCTGLGHITFPNNLQEIGNSAFYGCSNLNFDALPKNLKSLGSSAFQECTSLTGVTLPSGLTALGAQAFTACSALKTVTLPATLTSIGDYCFSECAALTSIVIPDSVRTIGGYAFTGCTELKSVVMPADAVSSGEGPAFLNCYAIESVRFTRGLTGIMPVINVNQAVMTGKLATLSFDEGVVSIEEGPFDYGSLQSVFLPSTLKSIGDHCFAATSELKEIHFPEKLESIGEEAFWASALESVILPDSLLRLGEQAFSQNSALAELKLGSGLGAIPTACFSNCPNLQTIEVPDNVTFLGGGAFAGAESLVSVKVPVDMDFSLETDWGENNPFFTSNHTIDTVIFTGGRTGALAGRGPEELFYIPDYINIRKFVFEESVREIGSLALRTCNTEELYFLGDAPEMAADCFERLQLGMEPIDAYYPQDNETWTEELLLDYGTDLNWIPYDPDTVFDDGEATVPDASPAQETEPQEETQLPEIETEETQPTVDAVYGGENEAQEENGENVYTASFSGLVPGEEYVFFAVYSTDIGELMDPDNLTFIDQAVADENGNLQFRYKVKYFGVISIFACGASHRNLADAQITVPELVSNGNPMLVEPTVVYDGKTLVENVDYVIASGNVATEAGDYVCRIRGICNYTGLVDIPYTLAVDPNHVASGACGEDLTWYLNTFGELTLSGSGALEEIAWQDHNASVETVIIDDRIGGLTQDAFDGCENLRDIYFAGDKDRWNALAVTVGEDVSVHYQVEDRQNHWTAHSEAANCTDSGYTAEICACGNIRNRVETDPALEHDWGSESFLWSEDHSACRITLLCGRENCGAAETYDCEISAEAFTASNCKEQSYVTYTAVYGAYETSETVYGAYGSHLDSETDSDHLCDTCDTVLGGCADKNGDNLCDSCGATICEHEDKEKPRHICDNCGKTVSNCADEDKDHTCDVCGEKVGKHEDTNKDHKCDYGCSEVIGTCEDKNNDGKCDYGCNKEFEVKPTEPDVTEPKPTEPDATEPEAPKTEGVTRLAGADRLVTSYLVADQLKAKLGVEKFQNIIVASGGTFADALPGSYLSAVKNAPILLTLAKDKYVNQTAEYIKANLVSGGTVYILGGESAVPASMEKALSGIKVQRVAGKDRFGTNLEILKEAGVKAGDEILVCTAKEFADSLSASATGMPILLVYKKITDEQKAYLATLSGNSFCVVGGTTAVPNSIAKEMETYGVVTRLAGKDRLETSTMVAEKYFASSKTAVVAYGWNFPDGLCGGSLAYAMDAPLILTHSKEKLAQFTADYTTKAGIKDGFVLGGDGLVDDAATRAIFGMTQSDTISILK